MARQFILPLVREILPSQPLPRAAPDERRKSASQRALVAASLILCPRDAGSRAADR
jgi:hypothetical protein